MSRWKRDDTADVIGLAAGVPDGAAVRDGAGNLIAWNESDAHSYARRVGIEGLCDDLCAAERHVVRF